MNETPKPGKSFLEDKIERLDAVYRRFGRDGLTGYPPSDVQVLLASKRLLLRDAPKGREMDEMKKDANRLLEMEIRDLADHVAEVTGAGKPRARYARAGRSRVQPKQAEHDHEIEP